ncbi:conjugative transfer region protein TrbK [Inquilinus ginsengisoli]|uniref:putative entry exclusion protein TrbK-alt n=1 Tax=Inquilinus ginsengisoli TaxID=363840 RepID=UPI003D1DDBD7
MEPIKLVRLATLALLGAGFLATALVVRREPETPVIRILSQHQNDLSAELARCRSLGLAGPEDPVCRDTWDQVRDRFLGKVEEER